MVKNLKSNSYDVLKSDFIFVCNGLHHVPNMPDIPGMDQFTGTQLHSRDYRTPERFEGLLFEMIFRLLPQKLNQFFFVQTKKC